MIDYYILGVVFVFTSAIVISYLPTISLIFNFGIPTAISVAINYLLLTYIIGTPFSTYILCGILALETVVFIRLIPTYRKEDIKIIKFVFPFCIGISLLVGRGCYFNKLSDISKYQRQDSLQKKASEFKSQFTFSLDSLGKTLKYPPEISLGIALPKLLIYNKIKGKLHYDYDLSQRLNPQSIAFRLEEIQTIIIIENTSHQVGVYDNNKTVGNKIITDIYFIDNNSMKIILKKSIEGEDPPQSIKSRREFSESVAGKAPTQDQIFEQIINVIK